MTQNHPKKPNILIIDDSPANLKLLTKILIENDYRVRIAPSAKLGINSIISEAPDLILLDIKMPDLDGYSVCQLLKDNEKTCDIPVIFISVLEDTMDKVKAFEMGGVDYIVKPFAVEEVLARIEHQLKISQKLQQVDKTGGKQGAGEI